MTITAPASVAGPCINIPASFGPVITETPGQRDRRRRRRRRRDHPDGCTPFTNGAAITGKWVYVDRGACNFSVKIDNAEAAGAEGIVVGNTPTGALGSIAGDSDIYGVMVSNADGTKFKTAGEPVDFTIEAQPSDSDPSHRWLSGETDPAFGGAIRDMWNPNCYGDPGKVSDAEYVCGTDDGGGVHSNSGVVNRAFAIIGRRLRRRRRTRAGDRARQGGEPVLERPGELPDALRPTSRTWPTPSRPRAPT